MPSSSCGWVENSSGKYDYDPTPRSPKDLPSVTPSVDKSERRNVTIKGYDCVAYTAQDQEIELKYDITGVTAMRYETNDQLAMAFRDELNAKKINVRPRRITRQEFLYDADFQYLGTLLEDGNIKLKSGLVVIPYEGFKFVCREEGFLIRDEQDAAITEILNKTKHRGIIFRNRLQIDVDDKHLKYAICVDECLSPEKTIFRQLEVELVRGPLLSFMKSVTKLMGSMSLRANQEQATEKSSYAKPDF